MAKPEWGVKRFCGGCGARFYDLGRDPIICPKCGVTHDPVVLARSQRAKATPSVTPKPKAKPEPVVVEAVVEDTTATGGDELLVEAAGESGESGESDGDDENAEEEEAIEDASELGEDKDDILEVIENVEGDKETDS